MASTQQRRDWWAKYRCAPTKMTRVAFPGIGFTAVKLLVASESAPVWEAVADIMAAESYLFREEAGGTYNCRNIGSTGKPSLHSYGIALDLNPKKNPHTYPPAVYDYPASFITKMEGIQANGKKAIQWGGRWSKRPDSMHWEIDVAPADCKNITWDKGMETEMADTGPNGEPNWSEVSDWAKKSWTEAHKAGILTDSSHPRDSLEVEQMIVYLDRAKVI